MIDSRTGTVLLVLLLPPLNHLSIHECRHNIGIYNPMDKCVYDVMRRDGARLGSCSSVIHGSPLVKIVVSCFMVGTNLTGG